VSRLNRRSVPSKLLTSLNPHGSVAEAYRLLRANLRFASVDKPLRSIAVTSAMENEGKTVTAVNLAITMSQTGIKTLLIDADLRKPAVHKMFMAQSRTGLTSVLAGMQRIEDAFQSTQVDSLWLLTAGEKPPNPTELLQSAHMEQLHRRLTADFEYVIYDCPPVLPAVEAADVGALTDGVLVVVRADASSKDAVRQAVEQLRHARARVLGSVLNAAHAGGYGYNYYAYSYGG